jgi:hypothetical protein
LYDKSSDVLWTRHFLEAQGYTVTTNIVYQDNMSTLSLAKNGYVSKRSKHIKAKYLYICHYHNSGELTLRYCPTDEMWADILTKPLQGSKFRIMRAFLMNCPADYSEDPLFSPCPVLQPLSNNIPMKPRVPQTVTSPRECVRAQPSDTKVSSSSGKLLSVPFTPNTKNISWRDALLADRATSTHSPQGSSPLREVAAAE